MTGTYRFPPNQGPISRFLSVLVLAAIFAVAFFVGTVFLVTVLGVIAILFLVFYLRFLWLRYKWRHLHPPGRRQGGVTLDGDYTVTQSRDPRSDDRD